MSETGWISGYVFLYLLQFTLSGKEERAFRCWAMWIAPVVGLLLTAFYITYGEVLSTLIMDIMVMLLAWCAIRGAVYQGRRGREGRLLQRFHMAILCFAAIEYCLWTASCFWISDTLTNPYFWFDFMLSGSAIYLLVTVRRAVGL